MKKYISMLLCAAMLASCVGCASDEVNSGSAPANVGGETHSSAEAEQPSDNSEGTESVVVSTEISQTSPAFNPDEVTTPEVTIPAENEQPLPTEEAPDAPEVTTAVTVTTPAETEKTPALTEAPAETAEADISELPWDAEYQPLNEIDVLMELPTEDITTDMDSFTVKFTYIGSSANEYCFGCDYTLKKWQDGDWAEFPLSENAAFNSLGYLIGVGSPNNSITVSLRDEFYAQPVTAGTYLLVKPMCDGVVLEQTFMVKDREGDMIVENRNGAMTLVIDEIAEGRLSCRTPWPYPAVYEVICGNVDCSDYCVGDTISVKYSVMYRVEDFLYRLEAVGIQPDTYELDPDVAYKPVIYLYPEAETEVSVQLDYNGRLTVTEPSYGDGWNVTAHPDGHITAADGAEYPYLFWEGENDFELDYGDGFCVSGAETEQFLREKLSFLGLNGTEAEDFLGFWLPHMERNSYNIIRFHGADYTDNAEMLIAPAPDTVIRVYMTYEATEQFTELNPQTLTPAPAREGFTVVEWGGGRKA